MTAPLHAKAECFLQEAALTMTVTKSRWVSLWKLIVALGRGGLKALSNMVWPCRFLEAQWFVPMTVGRC